MTIVRSGGGGGGGGCEREGGQKVTFSVFSNEPNKKKVRGSGLKSIGSNDCDAVNTPSRSGLGPIGGNFSLPGCGTGELLIGAR